MMFLHVTNFSFNETKFNKTAKIGGGGDLKGRTLLGDLAVYGWLRVQWILNKYGVTEWLDTTGGLLWTQ
jgi:hypothetical protein